MSFVHQMAVEPPIDARIVQQIRGRALPLLRQAGADGLFVFAPANILGFTGVPLAPNDRIVCGLLNAQGSAALICPAFESPPAALLPPDTAVWTWNDHDDPYEAIARAADHLGLAHGILLLDSQTWLSAWRGLSACLPSARLREDPGVISAVRCRKSPEEIEAIAATCRAVGAIFAEVTSRLRPGITEIALATAAALASCPRGGHSIPLVQSGPNAATPHRPTGDRALAEGDCVIVDFYQPARGYWGDMTRTFAVGRPSDEARAAYHAVRAAHQAGIAACRPGAACQDIDRAARRFIDDAGLGRFFIHRLGHGIGLDGHEPPYLVAGNPAPLETGMCVTIEPGVYVPGRFGIRIEDSVVITDDGCRVLADGVPTDVSSDFD